MEEVGLIPAQAKHSHRSGTRKTRFISLWTEYATFTNFQIFKMPRVNLKLSRTTGLGTLECVGGKTYNCGGKAGFAYPADTTIGTKDKKGDVYSSEYTDGRGNRSLMKWSVLWIGQRGVYFHGYGTLEDSHGCIHLSNDDAQSFYNWVKDNTRIVFSWKD
jgi:hypothetical protein